jgi:hypothetical protein
LGKLVDASITISKDICKKKQDFDDEIDEETKLYNLQMEKQL